MLFGRRNAGPEASGQVGANELPIPGAAFGNAGAQELLRAWSVDGGLQMSLQRNFDDPAIWGLLLTDIARTQRDYWRQLYPTAQRIIVSPG